MFRFFANTLLSLILLTPALVMADPSHGSIEMVKAYIPIGFDENDNAQVVTTGFLPNTCYRMGPYDANVDTTISRVFLRQEVNVFPGFCGQIIIPFMQVVNLGPVPAGNYTVWDTSNAKLLGQLPVVKAPSHNVDDFVYANVNDAFLRTDPATGRPDIVVEASLTNRCTIYKNSEVHFYSDVIVVQPILESVPQEKCDKDLASFEIHIPVPSTVDAGTYLLHVRSMGGQAVNKLVNIQ